MTEITRTALELEVQTGEDNRLRIFTWENQVGRLLVSVAPEHRDRGGTWHLSHSGLLMLPDAARALAPALLEMAAAIDGTPTDPEPTEEDRDDSRWP